MKKNKLQSHIRIYLYGGGIISFINILLLIIRFKFNIYIVDPYYIICSLIIGLTMFGMAITTITGITTKGESDGDNN